MNRRIFIKGGYQWAAMPSIKLLPLGPGRDLLQVILEMIDDEGQNFIEFNRETRARPQPQDPMGAVRDRGIDREEVPDTRPCLGGRFGRSHHFDEGAQSHVQARRPGVQTQAHARGELGRSSFAYPPCTALRGSPARPCVFSSLRRKSKSRFNGGRRRRGAWEPLVSDRRGEGTPGRRGAGRVPGPVHRAGPAGGPWEAAGAIRAPSHGRSGARRPGPRRARFGGLAPPGATRRSDRETGGDGAGGQRRW